MKQIDSLPQDRRARYHAGAEHSGSSLSSLGSARSRLLVGLLAVWALCLPSWGCGGADRAQDRPGDTTESVAQPAGVECQFWQYNNGSFTNFYQQDLSRRWDMLVPIHFPGRQYASVLYYDRVLGEANLYHTTGNGVLGSLVRSWTGWRKTWDSIFPIVSGTQVRLVYYDQSLSEMASYTLDENGNWGGGVTASVGRYDAIVPGQFYSTSKIDVAGYSRTFGSVAYWTINITIGAVSYRGATLSLPKTFDHLVGGNFMGTSKTDLVLFDRDTGDLGYVNLDGVPVAQTTQAWNTRVRHAVLTAGDFGGSTSYDDLLYYDQEQGRGEFYHSSGTATPFSHAADSVKTTWRTSWARILSGKFRSCSGYCNDDLMFYDDEYLIRIRPVVITGPAPATVDSTYVPTILGQFNATYGQAGLRFDASPAVASTDPALQPSCDGTSWTYANSWAIQNYPDELVMFVNTASPAACSNPDKEAILVNGIDEFQPTHELGHFFDIHHIWSDAAGALLRPVWDNNCKLAFPPQPWQCTESYAAELVGDAIGGAPLDAYALDWDDDHGFSYGFVPQIWDTAPSPGYYYWYVAGINRCDYRDEISVTDGPGNTLMINPERNNIMDYTQSLANCATNTGGPDWYYISPMQARHVRYWIRAGNGPLQPRIRLVQ